MALVALSDVVGLYLNPPQEAIVLCVDEKSQIQALDRTQLGLPLKGAGNAQSRFSTLRAFRNLGSLFEIWARSIGESSPSRKRGRRFSQIFRVSTRYTRRLRQVSSGHSTRSRLGYSS